MKHVFLLLSFIWLSKSLWSQSFTFPSVTTPAGCVPPDNYTLYIAISVSKVIITQIYSDDGVTGSFAYNVYINVTDRFDGSVASIGNFYTYTVTLYSTNPAATSTLTNNSSTVPLTSKTRQDVPIGTNPTFNGSASSLGLVLNGVYSSPDTLVKLGYTKASLDIDAPCIGPHTLNADGIILPVTLSELKATNNGDRVILEWATFTEINNAGFYVERSFDGRHWQSIAWVASTVNNATTKTNYHYIDSIPLSGINFYRLTQKDIDGKTVVSNNVSVIVRNHLSQNITVTPNPAYSTITLTASNQTPFDYLLYNTAGQLIIKGNSRGNKKVILTVSNLPEGLYLLKTDSGVHKLTIKH
ncbi:T9SS type A sorting domain-containing protein [Pinibacter aurantiacus]|uniref:T9SS type A sorting domain-containing protein n=1 Tax=Pinibacter aurantiacus TaxID=2851599 RepID=A0A9E2SCV4_9BACT|nr:T9SS type A sorting domain-containing protein [Pinibacter aurantiacus]MBV4359199.1 T9SS type A sorting domain-containing protein [Pinibacter aurantiacus]